MGKTQILNTSQELAEKCRLYMADEKIDSHTGNKLREEIKSLLSDPEQAGEATPNDIGEFMKVSTGIVLTHPLAVAKMTQKQILDSLKVLPELAFLKTTNRIKPKTLAKCIQKGWLKCILNTISRNPDETKILQQKMLHPTLLESVPDATREELTAGIATLV